MSVVQGSAVNWHAEVMRFMRWLGHRSSGSRKPNTGTSGICSGKRQFL